jgi:hypothetical protein
VRTTYLVASPTVSASCSGVECGLQGEKVGDCTTLAAQYVFAPRDIRHTHTQTASKYQCGSLLVHPKTEKRGHGTAIILTSLGIIPLGQIWCIWTFAYYRISAIAIRMQDLRMRIKGSIMHLTLRAAGDILSSEGLRHLLNAA